MPKLSPAQLEELKAQWTDALVVVVPTIAELKRFEKRVGRVVTVNWMGKAIVDFGDGAWYDIPAQETHLTKLAAEDERRKLYDPSKNSAQAKPSRA